MEKMKKYQVVGGQHEPRWIGEANTLHGAKVIASRNKEHWNNFRSRKTPFIYRAEDVWSIENRGRIPAPGAMPVE